MVISSSELVLVKPPVTTSLQTAIVGVVDVGSGGVSVGVSVGAMGCVGVPVGVLVGVFVAVGNGRIDVGWFVAVRLAGTGVYVRVTTLGSGVRDGVADSTRVRVGVKVSVGEGVHVGIVVTLGMAEADGFGVTTFVGVSV